MKYFTFEEFIKLDKTFRVCDKLEEIFETLLTFFEEKKVIIKELRDDSIKIGLKTLSITGKEKIVEIKLDKKEMNKDSIVKKLCNKINKLEEENKNLKEEVNVIKNELYVLKNQFNELKTWKNNREEEMKKLIEEKKSKTFLANLDTKILTKNEEFELIEKAYKNNDSLLVNKNFTPKLLYRATRDGDSSQNFHSKCDNIKGTLTLVKTNEGLIFGGYTSENWNGNGYKKDNKAFCFSIDLKKIYHSKNTNYALYCHNEYGPVFGNYYFAIDNNCFTKGGMMNDGLNGNYDNQQKENEINRGQQYFGVSEVEVFKVILE